MSRKIRDIGFRGVKNKRMPSFKVGNLQLGVDVHYICSFLGFMKILELISSMIAWISFMLATKDFLRNFLQNIFLGVHVFTWSIVIIWYFCYLIMLCKVITFDKRMEVFATINFLISLVQFVIGAIIADDAVSLTRRQCIDSDWCDKYDLAAAFGMITSLLFFIDAMYHWSMRDKQVQRKAPQSQSHVIHNTSCTGGVFHA